MPDRMHDGDRITSRRCPKALLGMIDEIL